MKKINSALSGLFFVFINACTAVEPVSRLEMIKAIHQRSSLESSHYNFLWYQGSVNGKHYFKHIRAYFLDEAIYSVSEKEIVLEPVIPYSTNSNEWIRVNCIAGQWHSARKEKTSSEEKGEWIQEECSS